MDLDFLMIGYRIWGIEETVPVVASEGSAYRNFLRKHVVHEGKRYFYNDFYTLLMTGRLDIVEDYKKGYLSVHEIPYMAVVYLVDYIRKRGLRAEGINLYDAEKELLYKYLDEQPMVIGISTSAFTSVLPIKRLVKEVRKKCPDSKILLGGAYLYDLYYHSREEFEKAIKVIGGDYFIVEPQGEQALYDVIKAHKENTPEKIKDIKNLYILEKEEGKPALQFAGFEREQNDLNKDFINWDKVDKRLLSSTILMRTSRGCAYRCKFCYYPVRNNKLQQASVETLRKELLAVMAIDTIKTVVFVDDMLNVSLKRIKEICSMMVEIGFDRPWAAYMRLDNLDDEAAYLLKQSNCAGVLVGIETANDNLLELMCKNITTDTYVKSLTLLKKHGVNTFGFIMTGFPGETKETVDQTIKLLNSGLVDYYMVNLWYAHKGTPAYTDLEEYSLEGSGFSWSHRTMNDEQASDETDRMLKEVTKAVYIPPGDFGMLSVPYLVGKGFSLEQVRELLILTNKLMMQNIGVPCDTEEITEEIRGILDSVYSRSVVLV